MTLTRRCAVLLALATTAMLAWPADMPYPSRPLTFVVPYPPGGSADGFARPLAAKLGERLGRTVIVDNRPGVSGDLVSNCVAKAPSDGYLLPGCASTITINPALCGTRMPYSPVNDLPPVSGTHSMAYVLVVNTAIPCKTVRDPIGAAKLKPGTIAFASAGNGSTMHLGGVPFSQQAGVQRVRLPCKGGPALNDVLGDQVPMLFNNLPAVVSMVRTGKLRPRAPVLPDLPSVEEARLKGVVSTVWNGAFVRAGTPREIVDPLNREIVAVLRSPDVPQSLEYQGDDVIPSSPGQFSALIAAVTPRWSGVVRESSETVD